MKFEVKMSGTKVTDYNMDKLLFDSQFITLEECIEKIHRQETMDWILDTLRFSITSKGYWVTTISWDDIMKLSILEYYPNLEKEMVDYFGEGWLRQYIRFNH